MIKPIEVARQYKREFPDFVGVVGVLKGRKRSMFPVYYQYRLHKNGLVERLTKWTDDDIKGAPPMTERKLTAEDRRRMLEVANNAVQFVTRHYVIDLIADLEAAEAEIERLRLDNRCGRHGGYLDEDFCYPCHTENLIKAEAEVERLRKAVFEFISYVADLECEEKCTGLSSNIEDYCIRCQARIVFAQPWMRDIAQAALEKR